MNYTEIIKEALDKEKTDIGHANVLIAGKTGTGKSTLINTIFQGNLATTGIGRPVTQNTREYTKKDIPITIIDTKGIEVADYEGTKSQLENELQKRSRSSDELQHVHAAWLCISEDSSRVEQAEIDLLALLSKYGIPTVVVITKARSDAGFKNQVESLLPEARQFMRVRAQREEFDGGLVLEPMGLKELVEVTIELLPDGLRNAFVAAQKIDMQHKVERSHIAVGSAALTAAGMGATPIPFSDAVTIVPIQITMILTISSIFGLTISKDFVTTIVGSAVTTIGGTVAGRAAVGALLKLIPGVGSIAGGAICGTTAAALTTAFGKAYILTLCELIKRKALSDITPDDIASGFVFALKGTK